MTQLTGVIFQATIDSKHKTQSRIFQNQEDSGKWLAPDEWVESLGFTDRTELLDAVNSGDVDGYYSASMEEYEINLIDIIKCDQPPQGKKFYLFSLQKRYGDYVEDIKTVACTDDPDKELQTIAQGIANNDDYDELHDGYWFDCNLCLPLDYKELTPQEAEIWSFANNL